MFQKYTAVVINAKKKSKPKNNNQMQTNSSNTVDANSVSINSFSVFGPQKDIKSPCFPCILGARAIWTSRQVWGLWQDRNNGWPVQGR